MARAIARILIATFFTVGLNSGLHLKAWSFSYVALSGVCYATASTFVMLVTNP